MQEILPLIADAPMDSSYPLLGSFTVLASLLASRDLTLCATEFALTTTEELRCFDPFTIARDDEIFQASIQTDDLIWVDWLEWNVWHLEFSRQRHVPVPARITFEGRAFSGAIHVSRLEDANPTDLWNVDLTVLDGDALRDSESGLIQLAAFESWEPGTLLKEVLVRRVQVF